jgi:hypothetical protein
MIDLQAIFGDGPAAAVAALPDLAAADPLAALPFADWVRRPDCHGRMGWEAPDLPEWQRWWARGNFDDFPPVPEGFRLGDIQEPAHHDCAGCVSRGMVDTQDVDSQKTVQGQLEGFAGV